MTLPQRYRAEDLHSLCCVVVEKLNVPHEDAREVGNCLVLADLRGVDSHGVIRLPVYAKRIRKNVGFMTKDEFADRMDEIVRMLKSSPPTPDVERVLAPGEIERQNEATNRVLGVPLVPSVIDQLAALGDELNVSFPNATAREAPAEARP